jgi:hypothetical protein
MQSDSPPAPVLDSSFPPSTAMRIVRNFRRNITRGLPERIGRFRCTYRYVTVGDATWQRARRLFRRKLITMRLTS